MCDRYRAATSAFFVSFLLAFVVATGTAQSRLVLAADNVLTAIDPPAGWIMWQREARLAEPISTSNGRFTVWIESRAALERVAVARDEVTGQIFSISSPPNPTQLAYWRGGNHFLRPESLFVAFSDPVSHLGGVRSVNGTSDWYPCGIDPSAPQLATPFERRPVVGFTPVAELFVACSRDRVVVLNSVTGATRLDLHLEQPGEGLVVDRNGSFFVRAQQQVDGQWRLLLYDRSGSVIGSVPASAAPTTTCPVVLTSLTTNVDHSVVYAGFRTADSSGGATANGVAETHIYALSSVSGLSALERRQCSCSPSLPTYACSAGSQPACITCGCGPRTSLASARRVRS